MSSEGKVPLQDPPAYHSGGGGMYPSVPPPYPGESERPAGTPYPTVTAQPVYSAQPQGPAPAMGPTVMHSNVGSRPIITTMGPTIIIAPAMGSEPCRVTCKSCHMQIVTRIERNATMRTHLMALLLCVFGCWPCVCVPYCVDSCLNADHYCPNCNAYIGSYQS